MPLKQAGKVNGMGYSMKKTKWKKM